MAANRKNSADIEAHWVTIRDKMMANADILALRGTIRTTLARKRMIYVLRFERIESSGRRIDCSIYIGDDPDLVSRAQQLLDQLRWQQEWEAESAAFAKFSATMSKTMNKLAYGRSNTLAGI